MVGRESDARTLLQDLLELSRQRYISPVTVAAVYAAVGERDAAFQWLWKGLDDRSWQVTWLQVDPLFDTLKPDARFSQLLAAAGLPFGSHL